MGHTHRSNILGSYPFIHMYGFVEIFEYFFSQQQHMHQSIQNSQMNRIRIATKPNPPHAHEIEVKYIP